MQLVAKGDSLDATLALVRLFGRTRKCFYELNIRQENGPAGDASELQNCRLRLRREFLVVFPGRMERVILSHRRELRIADDAERVKEILETHTKMVLELFDGGN